MSKLETYSVLIAWNDNDYDEGEYGWVGRATSAEDAEDKTRRAMLQSYQEDYGDPDYEEKEYDPENPPYGRVIECEKGAIWKAGEIEDTLRDILEADSPEARDAAYAKGREILAEIDGM